MISCPFRKGLERAWVDSGYVDPEADGEDDDSDENSEAVGGTMPTIGEGDDLDDGGDFDVGADNLFGDD